MLRRLPVKPDLAPLDRVTTRRCKSTSENNLPCVRHDGHRTTRLPGGDELSYEFRGLEVNHVGCKDGIWYAW